MSDPEVYLDYLKGAEYQKGRGDSFLKGARNAPHVAVRRKLLGDSMKAYKKAIDLLQDYGHEMNMASPSFREVQGYVGKKIHKKVPSIGEVAGYVRGEMSMLNKRISNIESVRDKLEGSVKKGSGLEKSLKSGGKIIASLSIFSFIVALFFISMNFTGAVIGSLPPSGSQGIGLGLIIIGIALALVYFRGANETENVKRKR